MRASLLLHPGILLLAGACASSNPSVPSRAGGPEASARAFSAAEEVETGEGLAAPLSDGTFSPTPGAPAVALVGGEEIDLGELLRRWMHVDSPGMRDLLERVVKARLVDREASRLSIELEPEAIDAAYLVRLSELEKNLRLQHPELTLDEWIAGGLALDPTRFREEEREIARRWLLAQRVVRSFTLSQDWAEVRMIVTETREEAEAALERVRGGAPFARIAAEVSVDPSGERGGRISPLPRNESRISKLVFGSKGGEVVGPVEEEGRWFLLQVEETHAPLHGSWGEIAEKIEASLQERPIEDPEFWMWSVEMQRRHPVDLSPFFELIGEPLPRLASPNQ